MEQKLDYPQSEKELNIILDGLYSKAKFNDLNGIEQNFTGLKEIMEAEATIITAIHNIKANSGSETPGADNIKMRDILTIEYENVIKMVKDEFKDYKSNKVKRVYIPKIGKSETRPLGIPTIIDRVVQECVRIVIEPILEAQFYKHSYGFRPMRDAQMTIKRLKTILHQTKYCWIVEGDISKFFDTVNHRKMKNKLWNMGIHDRRVLMIIQEMLQAGILNGTDKNTIGTPQGGIISPLLANVYLHSLDKWISREWEEKKTQKQYSRREGVFRALKKTNLKPAYYIRYADDWLLITDTEENAKKWKYKIAEYLKNSLDLELSDSKTLITNITKRNVTFLGYDIKVNIRTSNDKITYITNVKPNQKRLDTKMEEIFQDLRKFRRIPNLEDAIYHLTIINSKIRGLINYYQIADGAGKMFNKYSSRFLLNGYKYLSRYDVEIVPANKTRNLYNIHSQYSSTIPALKIENDVYIGLTNPRFFKWIDSQNKNQEETPYTEKGRALYVKRTQKKLKLVRGDEYFNLVTLKLVRDGLRPAKYNFEYYMNRGYVINRDKFKCRICKSKLVPGQVEIHHIDNSLSLNEINRVSNLASICTWCHIKVHDGNDYSEVLDKEVFERLNKFREKLKNKTMK